MSGWDRHEGTAVALDLDNVDTDQIIPARFMSTPRAQGYGGFLFHDLRHGADGAPVPAFPLNRTAGPSVLVAGRNFGSGSSREAAVYALVDAGFRAVVAPGFGDIFAANAVNNGLLPARVDVAEARRLLDLLADGPAEASVDLRAGTLRIGGHSAQFHLDTAWRDKLVNGWDDIDLTLRHADAIRAFRDRRRAAQPWTFPRR